MGLQLLQEEEDPISAKSILSDSTDACSTAISILNDLLLYDKIEEGHLVLELQTISVRPFLLKCIRMFQLQATKAGVTLHYIDEQYIPESMDQVKFSIDINKISQVLRNLVSNAIKFTPPGGSVIVTARFIVDNVSAAAGSQSQGKRETETNAETENNSENAEVKGVVRIEVCDTGRGIAKVYLYIYIYVYCISDA